jgi:sulfoxide reductase heme-binding subunit YedZ
VVHYWWLVKTGVRSPWKVTAILVVLLLARVGYAAVKRWGKARAVIPARVG